MNKEIYKAYLKGEPGILEDLYQKTHKLIKEAGISIDDSKHGGKRIHTLDDCTLECELKLDFLTGDKYHLGIATEHENELKLIRALDDLIHETSKDDGVYECKIDWEKMKKK